MPSLPHLKWEFEKTRCWSELDPIPAASPHHLQVFLFSSPLLSPSAVLREHIGVERQYGDARFGSSLPPFILPCLRAAPPPPHPYIRCLLASCIQCSLKGNSWHLIPTSWCLISCLFRESKNPPVAQMSRRCSSGKSGQTPVRHNRLMETFPFCQPGIPGDGWQQHPLVRNNVAGVARASSSTRGLDLKPRQRLKQEETQTLARCCIVFTPTQILLRSLGNLCLTARDF